MNLPKKIIRTDDGAEFLLNERDELYYLWLPLKGVQGLSDSGMHGYTYERLMDDPRSKGVFKVADGTEDLKAMRKAWFDKVNDEAAANKGCGHE